MAEKNNSTRAGAGPFAGMRPGGPMGGGGVADKPKDLKGTAKKLLGYLKAYRFRMVLVIVFAIIGTIFAIVSPKILGRATNQLVDDYIRVSAYDTVHAKLPAGIKLPEGTTGADLIKRMPKSVISKIPADKLEIIKSVDMTQKPTYDTDSILRIILLLLVLYVISSAFSYAQAWVMSGVTQRVAYRFRRDISKKINRLPLSYFDKRTYGEVLSKITNDVDTVGQTLNQSLSQIISAVVMIIGIIIMMLSISLVLTLTAVIVLPISFGLIGMIMKKSQKHFLHQQQNLGELNGHVEEIYGGHQVVKAFNGESGAIKKFNDINEKLFTSAWKAQFLSSMMFPIMSFVGNLGYVGVAVVGGWLAVNGKLKIGDIQAFIQYTHQFNQPIIQISNIMNVFQSMVASAERVFEFLDEPEEISDTAVAKITNAKGAIDFREVVFSYDAGKPIIKGLSLKVEPGQKIAIVGKTGAGKTTLVNLLMRFYDVDSGAILIDGINISDIKRSDVRKQFGMVLQDTWLFHGTIRENLLYGNPAASEEDLADAIKNAHVGHFIASLPGGLDMEINEEADNISQGEKQLLTIARAMVAKTPMLILDEATSSVDTRTEMLIQKAMTNLMRNKTSFVIAHRLSTIRDADIILMMQDGDIVEHGNHQQLLAKNGAYAKMYNSQFVGNAE